MEDIVPLFKALADQDRIRIIALLIEEAQTVPETAIALGLPAPTVQRHLEYLYSVGLVDPLPLPQGALYRWCPQPLHAALKNLSPARSMGANLSEDSDAFDRKTLEDFVVQGKLKTIPVQTRKRDVVLRFLAQQFDPEQTLTEKEISLRLAAFHPDFATLRRALVDSGLMSREKGIYRRVGAGRLI